MSPSHRSNASPARLLGRGLLAALVAAAAATAGSQPRDTSPSEAGSPKASTAPAGTAAAAPAAAEAPRLEIADTEVRALTAEHSGVDYQLYVRVPDVAPPQGGFDVVYLLDADYSFLLARNISQHLADRDHLDRLLLVGIAYRGPDHAYRLNRTRDYTPTRSLAGGYGPMVQRHSGGGPDFARFLERELIPFVERSYPASSRRTLVGHSYGGLFASWMLITRPGLFQRFIIVSPSLWYDGEMIFDLEAKLAQQPARLGASVYFGVGAREVGSERDMPALMRRFVRRLEARGDPSLRLASRVWEDETHNSIFPLALSTGLRFVHDGR